jgi:hypothetical protein
LKKLEKIMPKRKSISEKFHNFQNTQEEDVQIVAPFVAKKKQPCKKVISKKKKRGGDG